MTDRLSIAYVDTSVVVAVVMGAAAGKKLLARLRQHHRLYSSNLLEAELREVARHEGLGEVTSTSVLAPIAWVLPDRPLTDEMSRVLAHADVGTTDLWHLSTALFLSPDPSRIHFLTVDARQAKAAKAVGFGGL